MKLFSAEILKEAYPYEYIYQEDNLPWLEYNTLLSRQDKSLLKFPISVADVFKKWNSWENNHHIKNICNAIEARAISLARADFIAKKDTR